MLGHHWGWGSRPGGREPVGGGSSGVCDVQPILTCPAQLCVPPPSLVGPQMPWVHFLRKLTRTHTHAHYFMGASKNNP